MVVPNSVDFSMEAGTISGIGGANAQISLTAVKDIERIDTLIGSWNEEILSSISSVSQASGAIARHAAMLNALGSTLGAATGIAGETIRKANRIVNMLADFGYSVEAASNVGLTSLTELLHLIDNTKKTLSADKDSLPRQILSKMAGQVEALICGWKTLTGEASVSPSAAMASSSTGTSQLELSVHKLTGTPLAGDSVDSPASGAFAALMDHMSSFTGWIPYTPKVGEALHDIALTQLGDEAQWVAIAIINGLSNTFVDSKSGSETIKIPVKSG